MKFDELVKVDNDKRVRNNAWVKYTSKRDLFDKCEYVTTNKKLYDLLVNFVNCYAFDVNESDGYIIITRSINNKYYQYVLVNVKTFDAYDIKGVSNGKQVVNDFVTSATK